MSRLDLIVIGASAGGLDPLMDIVERLPAGLPVAILVVVHTRAEGDSLLPRILGRASALPVVFAANDETIRPGTIYVAPPDFHLLVVDSHMRLNRGPRENGFRPAVDPLFRSAARHYGARVMGVILSGSLDDGAYGLKVLKEAGGLAVVQDPDEASFSAMPVNAMQVVSVDYVLGAAEIADVIARLSASRVEGDSEMARTDEPEPQDQADHTDVRETEQEFGPPSALTCPDCGGALWEIEDGKLTRYRCHVGHQFSMDGLDAEHQNAVEGALWSAVRVLEEHADLRKRMARRANSGGMRNAHAAFQKSAHDLQRQAHTIRELLFGRAEPSPLPVAEVEAAKRARRPPGNGPGRVANGKGRRATRRRPRS